MRSFSAIDDCGVLTRLCCSALSDIEDSIAGSHAETLRNASLMLSVPSQSSSTTNSTYSSASRNRSWYYAVCNTFAGVRRDRDGAVEVQRTHSSFRIPAEGAGFTGVFKAAL